MSPSPAPTLSAEKINVTLDRIWRQTTTSGERAAILQQARTLLEQLYVHLSLKQAIYALDPLRRLRNLELRAAGLSEREFHYDIIAMFNQLHDRHTSYVLPAALQPWVATLLFRVEAYFAEGRWRYIATNVLSSGLGNGDEITHWNGVPIERAVAVAADQTNGATAAARRALGLAMLTMRPLGMVPPPDEEWVIVTSATGKESRHDWIALDMTAGGLNAFASADSAHGVDPMQSMAQRTRKRLFAPEAVKVENAVKRTVKESGPAVDFSTTSKLPQNFAFRMVKTPAGEFAYVRIWNFETADPPQFLAEFVRIIRLLPPTGLILDIRENSGGSIVAAELLLQTLTPRRIVPERFHFRSSQATLAICEANPVFSNWVESVRQGALTGVPLSRGFPIEGSDDDYNTVGQTYQGSVVLLTDGLTYSAADVFAAGFRDNRIGSIVGLSDNVGAGGANAWSLAHLKDRVPADSQLVGDLPLGISFGLAIRQSTRVGAHAGVLLEDLGIQPDFFHDATLRDLLEGNPDLFARAGKLLAAEPRRRLSAVRTGSHTIAVETAGIDRIDVYAGDRPLASRDIGDGKTQLEDLPDSGELGLRGLKNGELAASTRVGGTERDRER